MCAPHAKTVVPKSRNSGFALGRVRRNEGYRFLQLYIIRPDFFCWLCAIDTAPVAAVRLYRRRLIGYLFRCSRQQTHRRSGEMTVLKNFGVPGMFMPHPFTTSIRELPGKLSFNKEEKLY